MANKKIITSAVAVAMAAVIATGGTFAWQSINQRAINEASDVVNPGGRLHDDFDGTNKDVYVENFADNDIFARVRLEEYMEVVMNKGTDAEVTKVIYGDRGENTETGEVTRTPAVHMFADTDKNDDGTFKAATSSTDNTSYWNWTMGSTTSEEAYFMPTFNKNKDSLVADTNGIYEEGNIGTISNRDGSQYTDYVTYAAGDTKTDIEIYDGDTNNIDEVGTDFANLANYADNIQTVENVEHTAAKIGESKGFVSMEYWINEIYVPASEYDGKVGAELLEAISGYWVYDTDGWIYWSSPIKAGETTGRLLDSIQLSSIMDDTWYYRIDVVGQFITANDLGRTTGTGFYDTSAGATPTVNALYLLKIIGVDAEGEVAGGGEEEETALALSVEASSSYYIEGSTSPITLTLSATHEGSDLSTDSLTDVTWSLDGESYQSDTTLSNTTNSSATLTISNLETNHVGVNVTATYGGETVSKTVVITNGPYVGGIVMYDADDTAVGASTTYKDGDNTFSVRFYEGYNSSVYDYDTSDAYTGAAKDILAAKTIFKIVDTEQTDENGYVEKTVDGVTLTQDSSDKTKLTVNVGSGVTETFTIQYECEGVISGTFNLTRWQPSYTPAETLTLKLPDVSEVDYSQIEKGKTTTILIEGQESGGLYTGAEFGVKAYKGETKLSGTKEGSKSSVETYTYDDFVLAIKYTEFKLEITPNNTGDFKLAIDPSDGFDRVVNIRVVEPS